MYRRVRVPLAAMGFLIASANPVSALEIWLSDVGLPGQGVVVDNLDRGLDAPVADQELFIWGRPDTGSTLGAIDLRLTSSNREVLDFTGLRSTTR